MTASDQRSRVRLRRRIDTDEPCVCTPDAICLYHYGRLDPDRQIRARRQAGVHEPYIGPRR